MALSPLRLPQIRLAALLLAALMGGGLPASRAAESAQAGVVSHRQDGTLLRDGQPFFPLGFYHVSWAEGGTAAQRSQDLSLMARAGFNVMATEPIHDDLQELPPLLDQAQRQRMLILVYGLRPATMRLIARQPALLGFTLMDDSQRRSDPASVAQLQAQTKSLAPGKLTYISLTTGFGRPESAYFGVSDAVGNQAYPVGDPVDSVGMVYPVMKQVVNSALRAGVVPIANLQTASQNHGPPLTPQQLRNMTYQALLAGSKGILYYAYRDQANASVAPDIWNALGQLAQEIHQLSPALLASRPQELASGRGGLPLVATVQNAAGQRLLFVLNVQEKRAVALRLAVPRPSSLTPLFGTDAKLSYQGGVLSGQLPPLAASVFQMP